MNTFINLAISLFFAAIDTYLIELYLKNTLELKDNTNPKIYYIVEFLLMCIVTSNIFGIYKNPFFRSICVFVILIITCKKYRFTYKDFLKTIFIFVIYIPISEILIRGLFQFIFNCSLSNALNRYTILYTILVKTVSAYLELILITYLYNQIKKTKVFIPHFKTISILLSIYFSITILITVDALFYFPSVGRTFVFVIFIYNFALIAFNRYQVKHENYVKRVEFEKQHLELEKLNVKKTQEAVQEMRKIKHNFMHYCEIIFGYLMAGQIERAKKYILKIIGSIENVRFSGHLGLISTDVIIDLKIRLMETLNVKYEETIQSLISIGKIEEEDLALLIALALDNAVEACQDIKTDKIVTFSAKTAKNHLILHFTNTIEAGHKPKFFKSSKLDFENHGFGVVGIKDIVETYHGDLNYSIEEDHVDLRIILRTDIEVKKD